MMKWQFGKMNCAIGAALFAITALGSMPAHALLNENGSIKQEFRTPAPEKTAVVHVIKQDLEKLLVLAARYNKYEITFSGNISGVVRNATLPMNIEKLLTRLSNHYDLSWKIVGKRLFISAASQSETRTLPLDGIDLGKLSRALEEAPINANKFHVMVEDNGRAARLVAPPSYLDAIFSMAERMRK